MELKKENTKRARDGSYLEFANLPDAAAAAVRCNGFNGENNQAQSTADKHAQRANSRCHTELRVQGSQDPQAN